MKIIKTISLLLLIGIVIYNVNYYTGGFLNSILYRHYGKDGGVTRQLQAVSLLSALYYVVLTTNKRLIFFVIGLFMGILSYIVSRFISYNFTSDVGPFCSIFACAISIASFYIINSLINRPRSI